MSSYFCPKPTGINDLPVNDLSVSVYQNPANSEIHVTVSVLSSSAIKINLISVLGQTIRTKYFSNLLPGRHTLSMDVNDLKTGMYFIKTNDGKQNEIEKFVKE